MASNLLSIAETSQEIQIDEEKLRHICSRVNVWDHYGISRSQYVSLSDDEKLKMLKGLYKNLMPVYFGNGKCRFKCKVNVMVSTCFSDNEKILSDESNDLKNMVSAVNHFEKQEKKQQKELSDLENGVSYSFSYNDMNLMSKPLSAYRENQLSKINKK